MSRYRILRDDGLSDTITRGTYASYDAAHQELERYYADLCCSDDRTYYRIVEPMAKPSVRPMADQNGEPLAAPTTEPIAAQIAEPRPQPFAEASEPIAAAPIR